MAPICKWAWFKIEDGSIPPVFFSARGKCSQEKFFPPLRHPPNCKLPCSTCVSNVAMGEAAGDLPGCARVCQGNTIFCPYVLGR